MKTKYLSYYILEYCKEFSSIASLSITAGSLQI